MSSSPSEAADHLDAEKSHPQVLTQNDSVLHDDGLEVPSLQHTTEKKLLAKIDFAVIPCLSVLYLLAFLDR